MKGNRGLVLLHSPEINRGPLIMEKQLRQRGLGEEGGATEVDSHIMRPEETL